MAHITLPGALSIYACLIVWIPVALAAIYAQVTYWAYFKSNFPVVWRSLGSPEMPDMRGSWAGKSFWNFLMLRRYRRLGDSKLKRLGDTAILLLLVQVITFLVLVSVVFGVVR